MPTQAPEGTHDECIDAYFDKWRWHKDNGSIPPTFGKITGYQLNEDVNSGYWIGDVSVCTWLGAENYYFEIDFEEAGKNSMSLSTPFDSPLQIYPPMAADIRASGFEYKLHARKDAVNYNKVFENNVQLASDHKFFDNPEQKCFDTFYKNKPTGNKRHDLGEQLGYCMGRCDARVLNTGK